MAAKYCFLEKYTEKYLPLGRHLKASAYSAYCHRVSIVLQVCPRHTKLKSNWLTFAHLSMAGRFLPTQSYRPMRALSWYETPWRQGQINLPPHIPLSLFLLLNLDVGVQRLDRRLLSPLAVVLAEVLRSIDHDAVRIKRRPSPTVSRIGWFLEVVLFASFDIGPENINIQVTVWSWLLMNGS